MKFLNEILESIELRKHRGKIKEIRYFHPDNEPFPAGGHPFHKGAYFGECYNNKQSFNVYNNQYNIDKQFNLIKIDEGIHEVQYNLPKYNGGIIVFLVDANAIKLSDTKIKDWIVQKIRTFKTRLFPKSMLNKLATNSNDSKDDVADKIGAFSIGNFFTGRYIDDNNNIYNENSQTIEINGISSDGLLLLAEEIAKEFVQKIVLVKDLNKNKFYLVNGD